MPKDSFVIDASAVVPLAVSEEGSGSVAEIFELLESGLIEGPIHAPRLIYTEVAHGLLKAVRRDRLSPEDAEEGYSLILRLPLVIHDVPALSTEDFVTARRHDLGAYDMVYVSLARSLDLPLVANDLRLIKNAAPLLKAKDVVLAYDDLRRGGL